MIREVGKKHYLISPYLFQLSILGAIGIVFCTAFTIFLLYDSKQYCFQEFLFEYWVVLAALLGSMSVYFLVCLKKSYEHFGYFVVSDSKLTFFAPFKKCLVFKYSDIQDIGIDYAWLSVNKQFWIYIGKEKIPHKYCHKINRLPINCRFTRIQYSESVFRVLLEHLPQTLQKKLYNTKNTVE